jgi:1,4-dihydroxy-2-naphthoyl-CoA hydrolase
LSLVSDERARGLNEFFAPLLPGMLGIELERCAGDEVLGHLDVTPTLIAGTGYLFAPAVVALADILCAAGTGQHLAPDANFTTLEMKTNFLSSARVGERVTGRATPAHLGRSTHVWDVTVTNETAARTMALFRCTQMVLPGGRGG